MNIENVILSNLIYNEEYSRKVVPFLKDQYFTDLPIKTVYNVIDKFIKQYNAFPSKETISISLAELDNINEETFKSATAVIEGLSAPDAMTNMEWLVDSTEKFCQDKAIYNAIMESIQIIQDKNKMNGKGAIPQILQDALAVSFDSSIGHDYKDDYQERFEFYHRKEERVPFDLELFNKITKGGLPKKTLNIALAGTAVGKSLFMCHCAAGNLKQGNNVLYITMEMSKERIAERIDANLMNVTMEDLSELPWESFEKKMERIKRNYTGNLVIQEYPTSSAGSANFRHLLNELRIKKNFVPDIIYIDYLNICCSSRIKAGSNVNSYTYIKAIAEELRGLAVEFNVPIVSATQTTRSGYASSDPGLEDTSESFGLPATADFMFALISSDELLELGQIMVKQLKNRYADPGYYARFVIGINRSKMQLYDAESSAQDGIVDFGPSAGKKKPAEDKPVMDNTRFGEEDFGRTKKTSFKEKFKDFG